MIRLTRSALGLLAVASLAIGSAAGADTVIYQTGFESPGFAFGNLNGQGGWSANGLPAVVQNSPAVVGTQAAAFSASGTTGQHLPSHALVYNSVSNAEPFVRVRADFFVGNAGTATAGWDPIDVFGDAGFIGHIVFQSNNRAVLGLASSTVGDVPVLRGVWNHFELDLNFQTGVQTAYVNGLYIGEGPFASTSTALSQFRSGVSFGPGTDVAALDVLSITSAGLTACCGTNSEVCTVAPFCPPGTTFSSPAAAACTPGACLAFCGTPGYTPPTSYAVSPGPRSIAVGDFNGDGRPDLAIANGGILLGTSTGALQSPTSSPIGSVTGSAVAVGDFNRDGRLDVVSADHSGNTVHLWIGNGDGTFQAAVNTAAGTGPFAIAVGDINGDGRADFAVANFDSNNVSVLLGNGDGTFQAAMNTTVGTAPSSVGVGDFNGDGKLDLAVSNFNSSNISILIGNGNGTFQGAVNVAVGVNPVSVVVADFNGDGFADLAVANSFDGLNGNSVSVLLGTGAGTFQAAVPYIAGAAPDAIAVGDVNGDGNADLAVANFNGLNVTVLIGSGIGTFQSAGNLGVASEPLAVAFGDFGADGRPDLAVANSNSNSLSILTNICMGACCNFITGNCTITLQTACGLASHTWAAGNVCSPNTCEQPGGCCDSQSACTRRTLSQCTEGKLWTAGVCPSSPCTVIGRCCNFITGSCSLTLIANCGPAAHTWDLGSTCSPNPCQQTGSCCTTATGACRRSTQGRCTGAATWTSSGVCSPSPCPPVPGVCCNFITGSCAITSQAGCGLGSHTWTSGGSCTPTNPCPPIAACCDGMGGCRRLTRERCITISGSWISGSVCSPSPCPILFATASCPADFNHSGTVDTTDVFDFLNAWFAGNPAADFSRTGLSVQSVFDYLNAWFAGCP